MDQFAYFTKRYKRLRREKEPVESALHEAYLETKVALFNHYRDEGYTIKEAMRRAEITAKEVRNKMAKVKRKKGKRNPTYTIVEAKTGTPLAMAKGAVIKKGQKFKINGRAVTVVKVDADTAYVTAGYNKTRLIKSNKPKKQTSRKRKYRRNSVLKKAGFRVRAGRNPDMPIYDPTPAPEGREGRGPVIPAPPEGLYRGAPPEREPIMRAEEVGAPVAEAPAEGPIIYVAYHYRAQIPLFKVSTQRPLTVGRREFFGRHEYEIWKVEGNRVFVRPIPEWKYFVTAKVKGKATPRYIRYTARKRDIPGIKEEMKFTMERDGFRRRDYKLHMEPFSPRRVRKYFTNPPENLPTYVLEDTVRERAVFEENPIIAEELMRGDYEENPYHW